MADAREVKITIDVTAMVDAIAAAVIARLGSKVSPPYTSDPRALHLPPGWSKRQWDDAGRRGEGDAKRPPLRKDPRGYSCSVADFETWAKTQKPGRGRTVVETESERRDRQLRAAGLL